MSVSILFVCLGNICRSPAAEGIMRHMVKQAGLDGVVEIQSCGLSGSWPAGTSPDFRMREAAEKRGIKLVSGSQKIQLHFFKQFDLIFAADHKVFNALNLYASPKEKSKIFLMTHFSHAYPDDEIPDPYFGEIGFEHVLDMLEDSCTGILEHIKTIEHKPRSSNE